MDLSNTSPNQPTATLMVRPSDAEQLWDALGGLIETDLAAFSPDEMVDLAQSVPSLLPKDLRRDILEFKRRAPHGDVLLLRGLIPSDVKIPPTVSSSAALPEDPVSQRVALLLLGVGVIFGEPFNYTSLWGGRIVQNLIPVPGKEYKQTSQSSSGSLDWHIEDAFREDRCSFVCLLCLRGDAAAATMYVEAKDLQLPPETVAVLREKRFQLLPDPAHVLTGEVVQRQIAVLSGSETQPEICYDMHHISPIDASDRAAADALRVLHDSLDAHRKSHVMETGDLLILDNSRVAHARGPFVARYDGTDRWLMRAMICGSALQYRRWGQRVIQ